MATEIDASELRDELDTNAAIEHIFFEPIPSMGEIHVWLIGVQEGDGPGGGDLGILDDEALESLMDHDPDHLDITVENGVPKAEARFSEDRFTFPGEWGQDDN